MPSLGLCEPTNQLSNRPRCYLAIKIGQETVHALVDTGATVSFVGTRGLTIAKHLDLPLKPSSIRHVRCATNDVRKITGELTLPIKCETISRDVSFYVVPGLVPDIILGMDFIENVEMLIDAKNHRWCLPDSLPTEWYPFCRFFEITADVQCHGIALLTPDEQARLKQLLDRMLPKLSNKLGRTDLAEHVIDVQDHPAVKQRYYLVSPKVLEAINAEVDRMLADGIIEPSKSDWSSPIVMVRKKNGTYRFCIDFRKVNAATKKDAYPIPYIDGILDKLRAARYISTIDLSQAYHQIPMHPNSKEITAFTVPSRGLFQFTRMPYGLSNAPATFQRLLDKLIGKDMVPHAFAYLDDVIIVTETFEQHLVWLERVLTRIVEAGLVINSEKCEWCREEVPYLGFVVTPAGLQINIDRVQPILEYPTPRNLRQLRRFIGMASWYRRFVDNFATRAEPLTSLCRKNAAWDWTEKCREAFDDLRGALIEPPVLAYPDFSVPFTLQTDASSYGIGAVLTQILDGEERVIAYASRTLNKAEKNYAVTEKECLAVVWAIEKFRQYLEGYRFTVITDHASLRWMYKMTKPNSRLARWALRLLPYEFNVEYRKGSLNYVPDALSRMYEEDEPEVELAAVNIADNWYEKRFADVSNRPKNFRGWKIVDKQLYHRRARSEFADLIEDLNEWKLVLPPECRENIIAENHEPPEAGHLGTEKTYERVALSYYWPGMYRDVRSFVITCLRCQQCKVEQTAPAGLLGHRHVDQPWMVVAADIMGPFPPSAAGFRYALVFQDLYTKWIEVTALKKANAKEIIAAFTELITCRWGTPEVLYTDNGTEFVNRAIAEMTRECGIYHATIPPYHAQANPVERVNRVLKTMITTYLAADHREWDKNLPYFRFAYNSAVHSSSTVSPAFLNFGRELRPTNYYRRVIEGQVDIPVPNTEVWRTRMHRLRDIREIIAENLLAAHEKQAKYYNRKHRHIEFAVGDQVLKRNRILSNAANFVAAKLAPKNAGPFTVSRVVSPLVYELVDSSGQIAGTHHAKDIKKCRIQAIGESDDSDSDDEDLREE